MDKEKLDKILISVENTSNSDLITASDMLKEEFNKTKELILDLTRHLDGIIEMHIKINKEYDNRTKPQWKLLT